MTSAGNTEESYFLLSHVLVVVIPMTQLSSGTTSNQKTNHSIYTVVV